MVEIPRRVRLEQQPAEEGQFVLATPEEVAEMEEGQAPGYEEYVQRAWQYVKGFFLRGEAGETEAANAQKGSEQIVAEARYTPEQQVSREVRRELFHTIESVWDRVLYKGEPEALQELVGKSVRVRGVDYTIVAPMGHGGQGMTVIAEHPETHAQHVMKLSAPFDRTAMFRQESEMVMRKTFTGQKLRPRWNAKDLSEALAARKRIVEIATLYKLTRRGPQHQFVEPGPDTPVIPKLIDAQFIPHPDDPNMRLAVEVMERIEGEPLAAKLEQQESGIEKDEDLAALVKELLQSVEYLHQNGVLHLDIKPENMLVTPDNRIALIDYGLAVDRERQAAQEEGGSVVYARSTTQEHSFGSPGYHNFGEPTSKKRDMFSVGRVMQDMVYGRKLSREEERFTHYPSLSTEKKAVAFTAERLCSARPEDRLQPHEALDLYYTRRTIE